MIGIAAGVALLFSVQVAASSIAGSMGQLVEGVAGRATVEVAARRVEGMDQSFATRAQNLGSVRAAAPLLEQRGMLAGTRRTPLTLFGVDTRLERLGGSLVGNVARERKGLGAAGLFVTSAIAERAGVVSGHAVEVEIAGVTRRAIVAGVLDGDAVGGLADTPIAVAPLGLAQRLAGMPGRVSRVLVEPKPGQGARAQAELRALAADRLDVRPSDTEVKLLADAFAPDRRSSTLFMVIAVVIGLLFAYNAMLLAMARRRDQTARLRLVGAERATVVATLAIEALALGLAAALLGLLFGDALSRFALRSVPDQLASGFTLGSQRVVEVRTVALSVAGGLITALIASAKPAIELYRVAPCDATRDGGGRSGAADAGGLRTLRLGFAIAVVSAAVVYVRPSLAPIVMGGLLLGFALILGPVVSAALRVAVRFARRNGDASTAVAVGELKYAPVRASALALIAGGVTLAIVAVSGTRLDLERGVHELLRANFGENDVWVSLDGPANSLTTQQFAPRDLEARLRRIDGVRAVYRHGAAMLDVPGHRMRVASRPSDDPRVLVKREVVVGDPEQAERRIRAGGWIAISESIAREQGFEVGEPAVIHTPTGPRRYRLAAKLGNYGWSSGTMIMNSADFFEAWDTQMPSEFVVRFADGVETKHAIQAVRRVLDPDQALLVNTGVDMRRERIRMLVQGLARMRQIATLILLAGVLALVASMFAAVWQRRRRLANLRALGMGRRALYRSLLVETTLVAALGGAAGFGYGLFVQFFATRWSEVTTGYLSSFHPALGLGAVTFAEVVALTALATMVPALAAVRVAPRPGSAS